MSTPDSIGKAGSDGTPHPRRWRPSPAIWITVVLHILAVPALIISPAHWRWIVGIPCAAHLVLALAGVWPRSTLLGPNMTRLPADAIARNEVALTFDDGPDPEITPAILDILDEYGAKATFFCIAKQAEKYPELILDIVRRGHGIGNHSLKHSNSFAFSGYFNFRKDLQRSQAVFERLTGSRPKWFRAPMGIRNPMLEPALHYEHLQLISWTRRGFDTVNAEVDVIEKRLVSNLRSGDILLLHDGNAARGKNGIAASVMVLPRLLVRAKTLQLNIVGL